MFLIKKFRQKYKYNKVYKTINVAMFLGCLGLAQVLKGTIVAAFPGFLPLFFGIQFFGSTIQGSLSDIYRRSVVLNIALCISIIFTFGLVTTHGNTGHLIHIIQILCILFIGFGGNADVVARAGIIDIHFHMHRRKIMSWTIFAEALSWVIIGVLIRYLNLDPFNILFICFVGAIILLILSLLFNIDDTKDEKHLRNTLNELKLVIKNHKKKLLAISLITLTGELAYFFFFYSQETPLSQNKILLADTYLSWFVGMSIGCWILSKFKSQKDFVFLILGLTISFVSIFLFSIGGMKSINLDKMFYFDSLIFGVAGFGSGIYLPCFYSMISRGYSIHFQGILTGWIDSVRVFGDAFSNIALLGIILFSKFAPIFISGILFLTSILLVIINKKRIQ